MPGASSTTRPYDRPEMSSRLARLTELAGSLELGGKLHRVRSSRRWRAWGPRLRTVAFAVVGAVVGLLVAGRVGAEIGPFDATLAARPSPVSRTTVQLAPLGSIVLDTHSSPLALDLRADQIGLREAERIAEDPSTIDQLGDDVADDVEAGLRQLALRCAIVAVAGGVLGGLASRLHWRAALAGGVAGIVLVGGVGAGTAATFDANAVAEPRYTGLLTAAPAAVGDVESLIERYGEYRAQLRGLVANVVTLYLAAENLPTFEPDDDTIRVLHVSDVHLNPSAFDLMRLVSNEFDVDAVVDTGDLTDWGTEPETQLVNEIGRLDVPYVFVRGNHDSRITQQAVAEQPNAVVLDGEAETVAGLRFWGIGDPRYTPNKDQPVDAPSERERAELFAPEVAERLAEAEPPAVDVALIHDSRAASELGGQVPLVLSGHVHEAGESRIEPPDDGDGEEGGQDAEDEGGGDEGGNEGGEGEAGEDGGGDGRGGEESAASQGGGDGDRDQRETVLLTEGSTGGAGLRGLQGEDPEPLAASVLYFNPRTRELVAYDRITLQGFGETGVTIERHVVTGGAAGDAGEDGGEGGGSDAEGEADTADGGAQGGAGE
jgi:predicted phosphodiesterase